MRALVGIWDGAGNLPPIRALVDAMVGRGHDVQVICHDSQREEFATAGASVHRFPTVPQWDAGVLGWLGDNPVAAFARLDETSGADISAKAVDIDPDVVLIDCMLPSALALTKAAGFKTVALVHAVYSLLSEFGGGSCKGPMDTADLALGMTYPAFDTGAAFPSNLAFVGPLRPELGAVARPRKDPSKPFVVACLSTGHLAAEQMDLLQRVCDALGGLEVEALVTTGRGIAPEALSVGANTTAERHVPHDAVLPGADLLITHAGHGTIMAGLRYGVPLLCLPLRADQPFNAGRVESLGLGVALDPTAPAEVIRTAISRLLGDGPLKDRVRTFSAQAAGEAGAVGSAVLIEALGAR